MEVLWLGHADCHDVNKAGAKAAHLSRLASCYRIPLVHRRLKASGHGKRDTFPVPPRR
jgi:hypothetical protein